MEQKYFIVVNGAQAGPFTLAQLSTQGVRPDTLVFFQGLSTWTKASEIPELAPILFNNYPAAGMPQPGAMPGQAPVMPKYHAVINGQQSGPYDVAQFASLGITADTPVWTQGMADWKPAGSVPELAPYLASAQSGNPYQQQPSQLGNPIQPTPEQQPVYPDPSIYQAGPGNMYPGAAPIPHQSWKSLAIVATVLGFLFSCIGAIFGIIAITKANKADEAYSMGDSLNGDAFNKAAKTNTIISLCIAGVGLIVTIINLASIF